MKRLEKPFHYDGGSYYTPQDKQIIKEITNDIQNTGNTNNSHND